VTHGSTSASESEASQNNSFYEVGTEVGQLPADLTNVASFAAVATQGGNADNFLAGHNIIVVLHHGESTITQNSMQFDGFAKLDTTTTTGKESHATDGSVASGSTSTSIATSISTSTPTSTSNNINDGTAIVTTGHFTETITSALFLKTLELFLQDTPNLGVVVSHDHFVFYDSSSTTRASNESIAMAFTDGSSIEIVGQAVVLHNIIAQAMA